MLKLPVSQMFFAIISLFVLVQNDAASSNKSTYDEHSPLIIEGLPAPEYAALVAALKNTLGEAVVVHSEPIGFNAIILDGLSGAARPLQRFGFDKENPGIPIYWNEMQPPLLLGSLPVGSAGFVSFGGIVEGNPDSTVALTVAETQTQLYVRLGSRVFLAFSSDATSGVFVELDVSGVATPAHTSEFYKDLSSRAYFERIASLGQRLQPISSSGMVGVGQKSSCSTCVVRILFVADGSVPNPPMFGQNIIDRLNASWLLSGLSSTRYAELAGTWQVGNGQAVNPAWTRAEVLGAMGFTQAPFIQPGSPPVTLFTKLNQTSANIALAVVGDRLDGGGAARPFGVWAEYPNEFHPYAMSTLSYALGDLTAPHEIGHVLGGGHEDAIAPAMYHARGWRHPSCVYQTMMGGYSQCPTAQRIERWSNPNALVTNPATGVSEWAGDWNQNMVGALAQLLMVVSTWSVP